VRGLELLGGTRFQLLPSGAAEVVARLGGGGAQRPASRVPRSSSSRDAVSAPSSARRSRGPARRRRPPRAPASASFTAAAASSRAGGELIAQVPRGPLLLVERPAQAAVASATALAARGLGRPASLRTEGRRRRCAGLGVATGIGFRRRFHAARTSWPTRACAEGPCRWRSASLSPSPPRQRRDDGFAGAGAVRARGSSKVRSVPTASSAAILALLALPGETRRPSPRRLAAAHGLCSISASSRRGCPLTWTSRVGRMKRLPRSPNHRPSNSSRSSAAHSNRSTSKRHASLPGISRSRAENKRPGRH